MSQQEQLTPTSPDAPPLSLRLLELATLLRQPRPDCSRCAHELEILAARAAWGAGMTSSLKDMTLKLSIAADEIGKLALHAHLWTGKTFQLLEGPGPAAPSEVGDAD